MSKKTFKGRPALAGNCEGSAEVSHVGFNTCATYVEVLISGKKTGVCGQNNFLNFMERDFIQVLGPFPDSFFPRRVCSKSVRGSKRGQPW